MSIEGRIAVIERIVREEGTLLEDLRVKLALYQRSVPALEKSIESNIKKLEELRNEVAILEKSNTGHTRELRS